MLSVPVLSIRLFARVFRAVILDAPRQDLIFLYSYLSTLWPVSILKDLGQTQFMYIFRLQLQFINL